MARYPHELSRLIACLKKLPGVGGKTAERFAFHFLHWQEKELLTLATSLHELQTKITSCPECHCLQDLERCPFCSDPQRDQTRLCIIASAKDAYALDETGSYKGLYHVLGGLLSPIQGSTLSQLHLEHLLQRIQTLAITEVILALDSTLEGDTTSLFLKEQLQPLGLPVSRLAFGIPMGSSLDFVDCGTLARALSGRQHFS